MNLGTEARSFQSADDALPTLTLSVIHSIKNAFGNADSLPRYAVSREAHMHNTTRRIPNQIGVG